MYVRALTRDTRGFLYVISSPTANGNYTVSCSFDSGRAWIGIGKPTSVPPVSATALAVDTSNNLLAGTSRGVFRYVGGYWDSVNTGTAMLPDSQITALAVGLDSRIFVGTNYGAYFSVDHGWSWVQLGGPGLPNHITALGVGTPGAMMPVVGTDTGLYEYAASTQAVTRDKQVFSAISKGHSLRFSVGKQELVDLRLYDARGIERMRPLHQEVASGTHEVSWGTLPEGVYFCRLRVGAAALEVRKIVVLQQ
jgi:hypothetical protein